MQIAVRARIILQYRKSHFYQFLLEKCYKILMPLLLQIR
jgi:hypothetical protein